MATIVTRSGKGSPLTNNEVDANFTNLNTDKAELSGATFTGVVRANAGVRVDNFTLDGTSLALSSGNFTLDVAGDMALDSAGDISLDADSSGQVRYKDGGAEYLSIFQSNSDVVINSSVSDKDIIFKGKDGASNITALTLDMSSAGAATFNSTIASGKVAITGGTASSEASHVTFTNTQGAKVFAVGGGQSGVTNNGFVIRNVSDNTFPLVISDAGAATFVSTIALKNTLSISSASTSGFLQASSNVLQFGTSSNDRVDFFANNQVALSLAGTGAATFNAGATFGASVGIVASGAPAFSIQDSDGTNQLGTIGHNGGETSFTSRNNTGNGSFKFYTHDGSTFTDRFNIASSGAATFAGDVSVPNISVADDIRHSGDSDTYISFEANNQTFYAGGTRALDIAAGSVVLNEGGGDVDFRVESSGNANMLFVDGGNNRVGIGSASSIGGVQLNVLGAGGAFNQVSVGSSANNSVSIGNHTNGDVISNLITSSSKFGGVIQGGTNGNLVVGIRDNDVSDGFFVVSGAGNQMASGYSRLRMSITPTTVVFNESSDNTDFRVESNGNANMLFVDGGNNRVGVGTNSPSGLLTVSSDAGVANQYLNLVSTQSGSARSWSFGINSGAFRLFDLTANLERLSIATNGAATFAGKVTVGGLQLPDIAQSIDFIQSGAINFDSNSDQTGRVLVIGSNRAAGENGGVTNVRFDETGGSHFNDGGVDADFRVESDSNANMLFVDGSNNSVVIGGSADNGAQLYINGNIRRGAYTTLSNFNSNNDVIAFNYKVAPNASTVTPAYSGVSNAGGSFIHMESGGGGTLDFRAAQHGTDASAFTYTDAGKYLTMRPTAKAQGELVVNQDGNANIDFRVESDANTHALFVDGGAGTVAINTATLAHNGNTAGSLIVNGGSAGSTSPIMMVIDGDGSVEADSVLLECSFTNDNGFSSARYVQFRDSGGTQGTISGTGDGNVAYNTSSDERLKQNIQDTGSKWNLVKSLQVRDYEWKKSGKQDTGFIAQELHDKWAQPVKVGGEDVTNDPWSVDYGQLTPVLTKALQEAMEKIETLEARIAALES